LIQLGCQLSSRCTRGGKLTLPSGEKTVRYLPHERKHKLEVEQGGLTDHMMNETLWPWDSVKLAGRFSVYDLCFRVLSGLTQSP
jgi:hypothetical protein